MCGPKLLSVPPSSPDLDKPALGDPLTLTAPTDHLQRLKEREEKKRKLWSKESTSAVFAWQEGG